MRKLYLVLGIAILLISCAKDLDFSQTEEFQLTPVFDVSLLFFEETPDRFIPDDMEIIGNFISDTTDLVISEDSFVIESLMRAELEFEFTNTIPRNFRAEVVFLNADQEPVRVIDLDVPQNNEGEVTTHIEDFPEEDIADITATVQLVVNFFLLPGGDPVTRDTEGILKLRSKGTFYLLIE
ncbi:hypothetical protein GTQ40_15160 [Flavobacteriaceae bacterium R38]|nr:hypothetical protein [Flavobacteriaceae bacterium R38]